VPIVDSEGVTEDDEFNDKLEDVTEEAVSGE
jgi:hypothetical protein